MRHDTPPPPAGSDAPPLASRRQWLLQGAGATLGSALLLALWPAGTAHALAPRTLRFPRDHGSHPDLRTEWWYITGHALAGGRPFGFQVTFFRSRVEATQRLQSAFAARQLVFAHAALTDLQGRKLHHDQRIARAGFGIAEAAEADTDVRLRDWQLRREDGPTPGSSRYTARVQAARFALDLRFDTTQPVLLQGSAGLSRKGPDAAQASYYYSQPQLAVSGHITLEGQRLPVATDGPPQSHRAWLDHEWSEALMHPEAVGWDWIGMNLDSGAALTAFRLSCPALQRRTDLSGLTRSGDWAVACRAATSATGSPRPSTWRAWRRWPPFVIKCEKPLCRASQLHVVTPRVQCGPPFCYPSIW